MEWCEGGASVQAGGWPMTLWGWSTGEPPPRASNWPSARARAPAELQALQPCARAQPRLVGMTTPPTDTKQPGWMADSSHAGPAWTTSRRKAKAKKRAEQPIPAGQVDGISFYSNTSSSSSLTLPQQAPPLPVRSTSAPNANASANSGEVVDAPYLTHVVHHHGKLTLVPPDNLGLRRQPGTPDPPTRAATPTTEGDESGGKLRKKRKKKKPDAEILRAVTEAGRTPPLQTPGREAGPDQAGTSGEMRRERSREGRSGVIASEPSGEGLTRERDPPRQRSGERSRGNKHRY